MPTNNELLKQLETQSLEHFIPECQNDAHRLDGLGISIAQYCNLSGRKICEIFRSALEDANYHTQVAIIDSWLNDGEECDDEAKVE